MGNIESLSYFIPELILTITVMLVLLVDILGAERAKWDATGALSLLGTVCAFFFHIGLYGKSPALLFQGMLAHDMFSVFFRGFFLLSTGIVIYMSMFTTEVISLKKGEYYTILLSVTIGMCLVAAAQNLIMIYLALELMSLGSYVLAGFSRTIGRSEEASLKYVLFGGVSTAILLFGLTLLYGMTGSMAFDGIRAGLASAGPGVDLAIYVTFIFILAGAGYKIAMVPFHFWAPDVYEGSPTPVTAYLSVASKGAGFALLIRLAYSIFLNQPTPGGSWLEVGNIQIGWTFHIAWLAAITMTLGNLGAIVQINLKRLMAYSGVAHAGYLLMGVCALSDLGLQSVIFYLAMYLFTNLVAFLVIIMMIDAQDDERITGIRGLWKRAPYSALFMTIALFSLIGLPPTAGFWGKFYLFAAILQQKLYWLALIGVLNTVVSLYYYARIIKAMLLESPAATAEPYKVRPVYVALLVALTLPILYFGIWWDPLAKYAKYCAVLWQ